MRSTHAGEGVDQPAGSAGAGGCNGGEFSGWHGAVISASDRVRALVKSSANKTAAKNRVKKHIIQRIAL